MKGRRGARILERVGELLGRLGSGKQERLSRWNRLPSRLELGQGGAGDKDEAELIVEISIAQGFPSLV